MDFQILVTSSAILYSERAETNLVVLQQEIGGYNKSASSDNIAFCHAP